MSKESEFKKKPVNVDDLKKMLDSYGLKGSEITKQIKNAINPNLIKPNSNPKEEENAQNTQGHSNS